MTAGQPALSGAKGPGRTAGWTVLVEPQGRSGAENMQIDEALLDDVVRSGNAFLRLYRWDPPTLSVGRNQAITQINVPVVRRPTGGQAVWHEDEVTYAVAAPISAFGSLRMAYGEIHTRLVKALQAMGVDAVLAGRPAVRPSARPVSCFAQPEGGEILVHGRKLVGSAQLRRGTAFLQHGSILLDGRQPGNGLDTTLVVELGRPVTFDEVARSVLDHWPSARQAVGPSEFASPASR